MKRAFDIFSLKGKGKESLNKAVNKDEGLPALEQAPKRLKKFELTDAQKQRQQIFKDVVSFGEKGLEGEAAQAANYRWKQTLGIPMKKVNIPYPELKRKLAERENIETREQVKRTEVGLPNFTRAPVIPHKKPKRKEHVGTLEVMPGTYKRGAVQLEKRDISRIYDHVKKRPKKKDFKKAKDFKKQKNFKKAKKGKH